MNSDQTIKVWDILVRISHWLLVASVAAAWFTRHGGGVWHEYIGYVALALVIIRVCWGFVGTRYARFSHFLRGPAYSIKYIRSVINRTAKRYVGHNPLAAWMSVSLLVIVFLVSASGWLYTTDAYWGVEWVEDLHEMLTFILLGLVALHVLGLIHTSFHIKENLVMSMFHGRKRIAQEGDID